MVLYLNERKIRHSFRHFGRDQKRTVMKKLYFAPMEGITDAVFRRVHHECFPSVNAYYIPATALAAEKGLDTLANMILVGKMIRETGVVDYEQITEALKKVVSAKHPDMLEVNRKALACGYAFEA